MCAGQLRVEESRTIHIVVWGVVNADYFKLDLPPSEERTLRAEARMRAAQQRLDATYRAHPWPFLRDCIWTLDQIKGAIRPLTDGLVNDPDPSCDCAPHGCLNYLHHLINRWGQVALHLRPERVFAVPKSRRMRVTWTLLACHLWLAWYRPGSMVAIQSQKLGKKETEGAAELVRRLNFMASRVPLNCRPCPFTYTFGLISFPDINSECVAMAQGPDQLRQHTCTAIFADECAFWEEASESYAASLPTTEGGGCLTMVSSANPGHFKLLVHDQLAA